MKKSCVPKRGECYSKWCCLWWICGTCGALALPWICWSLYLLIAHNNEGCVGKLGRYEKAAVASDAEVCTQIGKTFLQHPDANIVDSAIATLVCMGVVNAQSMGIGGGFYLTMYARKERKFYALDAREVAPLAAHKDMYKNDPKSSVEGVKSIAVPGEIAGYKALHEKFGKLPWKQLFKPTVDLCRNGFRIAKGLHVALQANKEWLKRDTAAAKIFVNPRTGKSYGEGDVVTMKKLAETLEEIGENKRDHFYNGSLANKIVEEIGRVGGIITKQDLVTYTPRWREPVIMNMTVRGRPMSMATLPPPSSGSLAQFIVKTMNGFGTTDDFPENSVEAFHRFMEVSKYAYGLRAKLGDEDFVNVTDVMKKVQSEEFMTSVRKAILKDKVHPVSWYSDFYNTMSPGGTAHLSIVDDDGNAISVTSTTNGYFGSKVIGQRTGIFYNDEMDDFSQPGQNNQFGLPPSQTNYIAAGKRPMSSMCPVIVTYGDTGQVHMVTGASGGSRILSAVAQILWRTLLHGQDLKTATDAWRIYERWLPPDTSYETKVDASLLAGLGAMGHRFAAMKPNDMGAVVQSIQRKHGSLYAYADTRKAGCADGIGQICATSPGHRLPIFRVDCHSGSTSKK